MYKVKKDHFLKSRIIEFLAEIDIEIKEFSITTGMHSSLKNDSYTNRIVDRILHFL